MCFVYVACSFKHVLLLVHGKSVNSRQTKNYAVTSIHINNQRKEKTERHTLLSTRRLCQQKWLRMGFEPCPHQPDALCNDARFSGNVPLSASRKILCSKKTIIMLHSPTISCFVVELPRVDFLSSWKFYLFLSNHIVTASVVEWLARVPRMRNPRPAKANIVL